MMELLILLVSLFVLTKSAQWVIDSSVTLARFFQISELAVGFLLISVATTFPEFTVSVISSYEGNSAIAVGNALGSVVTNLLLILGLAAVANGVVVTEAEMLSLANVLLLTLIVPATLLLNLPMQGFLMVASFFAYAYYILTKKVVREPVEKVEARKAVFSSFYFLTGMFLVVISAKLVVDNAVLIAQEFKVSSALIGATVIAIGTSLPELTLSATAMKRKHQMLAIGNILGASVTDLTLVLGVSALIKPFKFNDYAFATLIGFALLSTILVQHFLHTNRKLERREGIILLVAYLAYLAFVIEAEAIF
jgi:cation:H+ antiporter